MSDYDGLRTELDAALTGRGQWKQFLQIWSYGEFTGPGQLHTNRLLDVRWSREGPVFHAQKDNAWNQPCDIQEFADVAAAIAWVETPRSEHPQNHRRFMAAMDAYARRPKPQDVACGYCGAQPGELCTTRTLRSLGDDVHGERSEEWKRTRGVASPTREAERITRGEA